MFSNNERILNFVPRYVLDVGLFLAKHLKGSGVPGHPFPNELECFDVLVGRTRPLPFKESKLYGAEANLDGYEMELLLFEPKRFAMKFQNAITDMASQKFELNKPHHSQVMPIDFGL